MPQQYELNLRDYWRIIQKRQLVIWVIFFAVLIPVVIHTNMQRPVYQASSSVQWTERRTFASLIADIAIPMNIGDPLVSQSEIITSLPVMETVVKDLGLVDEGSSATEIMEQASDIQGGVSTSVATGTNIIYINVIHENPKLAADIANKVAEVYIVENLKEKSKQSRAVREFIEKQLGEVSVTLEKSEEALARFKEIEVPSGIALPLQGKLMELESKRQSLLQIYTERHPDVKKIDEEIAQVKEQLRALPQKELEYSRLQRDVEINASLYRSLKDKLEGARIAEAEKVEDVSQIDHAVPPERPIRPNKKASYLMGGMIGLILGLAAASILEQLDTSIGTIEDVESFIGLPVLGVIPYLKTKDEKKKSLIQRIWPGEIKGRDKASRLRNQLIIHYSTSSPVAEAYKILRTNIQTEIFKEKIQGKILLLTSSAPEEGKSITASNLAIAMAQGGLRTLLLDADMRRPSIHNIFGIQEHRESGLSDALRGSLDYKDAVRTVTDMLIGKIAFDELLKTPGIDNLNIITSGSLPTTPSELLSSAEMANLLDNLKATFDIILIDTPPVLAVADATILAPKTDAVILVYRVGKTSRSVLSRAKTQITEIGGQVKGVVLNNISPEIEMRYGYYYHYKYYGKYYTEKRTETET